jgi:hypothetical protein
VRPAGRRSVIDVPDVSDILVNENVLRAKIRSLRTQQRAYAIDGAGSWFRQPEGRCTDSPAPAATRTSQCSTLEQPPRDVRS